MKEFEVIKLLFVAIPTGMFATYGIFWAIILTLKVKRMDDIFRKIMSIYSFLAGVTGLLLVVFYFFPDLFCRLNILYGALAAYTMIVFHHFLYHAARLEKRFSSWHYISPLLVAAVLLGISLLFPDFWAQNGNTISLSASFVFGLIYSALPLYEMYKFQIAISLKLGTEAAVDNSKAVPFACEILLYPIVSILILLIGGSNPSIALSILLMLCCGLALMLNIPLTYDMIRHYVSNPKDTSLFEAAMTPVAPVVVVNEPEEAKEEQPKRTYRKYPKSRKKGVQLVELDKKEFDSYFRGQKPYLNPDFVIADVVEALQSNRTYISKFVNVVYGMSFTSYVNLCRLRELERLRSLPSNKGKSEAVLSAKAGFGKYRNYLYVKKQFATQINTTDD